MLNILDKEFFQSDFSKKLARKFFGYRFDEDEETPKVTRARRAVAAPPVVQQPRPQPKAMQQPAVLENPQTAPAKHQRPDFKKMFGAEAQGTAGLDEQVKAQAEAQAEAQTEQAYAGPSTKHTLSLYDLVRHYKNQGVVGEESLSAGITMATIGGCSLVVLGPSRSGKTFVTDKLVGLLPGVYTLQQASRTAPYLKAHEVNNYGFVYIPEFQKIMRDKRSPMVETIKDLTEGKDSNRTVTRGNKVITYSFKKGIQFITTLAAENDFKMDVESAGRLIHFRTDSSEEHQDEILKHKAKNRYANGKNPKQVARLENNLKEHLNDCLNLDVVIKDLFAPHLEEKIIPRTQKSPAYIDHYYSLVDGCAKFHYNQRTKVEVDGQTWLFVSIEDHINAYNMYYDEFVHTLKDLAEQTNDTEALNKIDSIQKPDLKACVEEAYRLFVEAPEFEIIRQSCPEVIQEWQDSQVDADGNIRIRDYKTGKVIVVEDIGYQSILGEVNGQNASI